MLRRKFRHMKLIKDDILLTEVFHPDKLKEKIKPSLQNKDKLHNIQVNKDEHVLIRKRRQVYE